ncbi:VOC family protein [Vreelandella sp. TE19]
MIDHTGINVSSIALSKKFYEEVLKTLGYRVCQEVGTAVGFGAQQSQRDDPGGDFWISEGPPHSPRSHIAFRANNQAQVRAFYEMAVKCGGVCNGAPGFRKNYHPNYYAAFIVEPDGYNIEAVCHE